MLRIFSIRMLPCLILAMLACALMWRIAPQQLPVVLYKATLVLLAGLAAYWLDRWAFPYARPDGYLRMFWSEVPTFEDDRADYEVAPGQETLFAVACCRRAAIMATAMLAVGLGL